MPAAVKAVALPWNRVTKHHKSTVRIGRHYSQDALLGNRYSVLCGDIIQDGCGRRRQLAIA